ncbi:MAG: hypothetical protein AB8G95_16895 [Anaerolineae bacterium]
MMNLIKKAWACEQENRAYWLLMGIFWASAILIGSWLSKGSGNEEAVFFILLTSSSSMFLFGNRKNRSSKLS